MTIRGVSFQLSAMALKLEIPRLQELAILLLGVVASLAGLIPARRASRIDPPTASRYE